MSTAMERPLPRVMYVVAPLVLGVLVVVIWQGFWSARNVPDFFMPSPAHIWTELREQHGLITSATVHTGWNALRGLVIGTLLALVAALVANALRFVREMLAPIVLAASVVPIAALAPVLNGLFNQRFNTGRVIVAAVAVGVPVYINVLRGLAQVKPVHRDLMHSYSVSALTRIRTVTLPTALPYLFTGLRIGSSLAVISALVAEYVGGPRQGLAAVITENAKNGQYALSWAGIVGSIALGLLFYLVTFAMERWFNRHTSA
ncbi:ABC transporter permease [Nocardioides sp. Kera G14]|uniref:ABC transporter permease n=1 Tax=Nocardioides sp. Kera G14 TaxID=2884264 RepID=UPI001D12EAF1|nr:ABC transporter permease subunit [Nocardioides sp. Kera G14]UDY24305.1 ABC transporter permease subunit [Nocardioides sp. Kera G14]